MHTTSRAIRADVALDCRPVPGDVVQGLALSGCSENCIGLGVHDKCGGDGTIVISSVVVIGVQGLFWDSSCTTVVITSSVMLCGHAVAAEVSETVVCIA